MTLRNIRDYLRDFGLGIVMAPIIAMSMTLAVGVVLTATGCASLTSSQTGAVAPHPGAINTLDSQAFDTLVTAKSVIDGTKTDLNNGVWSATIAGKVKAALNNEVIPAYNVADTSYKLYHTAAVSSDPGTQLTATLAKLTLSLTDLTASKGGN